MDGINLIKGECDKTMPSQTVLVNTFIITAGICYLYTFLEWLFFVTKPSSLANWGVHDNLSALMLVPLPAVLGAYLLFLIFRTSMLLVPGGRFFRLISIFYLAAPSSVLAALVFILVENFTYTLFGFSIGSFTGATRFLYLLLIILFAIWTGKIMYGLVRMDFWRTWGKYLKLTMMVLLFVSMAFFLSRLMQTEGQTWVGAKPAKRELANILVLSTDGLDASHMSVYGYQRDTTPFIRGLAPQSLVVMNHFTNNTKSTGSIGALFTGKLPTSTRVIYPPDVFQGLDAYQHMPGLLRSIGYRTADFSIRHYTDPYDLNIRDGFDQANGREFNRISRHFEFPLKYKKAFVKESYFFELISNRLIERAEHALAITDMVNPYVLVTDLDEAQRFFPDSKRIDQLFEFMDDSNLPFFAHVHLMGTHGPKFKPREAVYSKGKNQAKFWMVDFYDDVILNYDQTVERVVNHLKASGRFEETLIILTSDHGAKWKANVRIPLILRFPNQQFVGVRNNNVQRIDVTASIIDYLGIEKPAWMEGDSFLGGEFEPERPIFFSNSIAWGPKNSAGWRDVSSYDAPYYSLGGVGVIVAQYWYYWNLSKNRILSGKVNTHTAPISEEKSLNDRAVIELIGGHLEEKGFPIPEPKPDPDE